MQTRFIYLASFMMILSLLGLAMFFQYHDQLTPCPLCILQRVVFIMLAAGFFLGIFFAKRRVLSTLINYVCLFISALGIGVAGRQVWLQYFPPLNNNGCEASIDYLMHVLPLTELIKKIFAGTTECSVNNWHFLSFTMAEWGLMWFFVFFAVSVWLVVRISSSGGS